MAILRHLQHQRTSSFEYVSILKSEIPANQSVQLVTSKPTQNLTADSPRYIQASYNNRYYILTGKCPDSETLLYGELAISFGQGCEAITIKNSANKLVAFKPHVVEKECVKELRLSNPSLVPTKNECVWSIAYNDILKANIQPETAVVFLRGKTGKQIVPDVTFNDTTKTVNIVIYSATALSADTYTAIIIGTSYMN